MLSIVSRLTWRGIFSITIDLFAEAAGISLEVEVVAFAPCGEADGRAG